MIFLIDYCISNLNSHCDILELLNEVILLLGYFCYLHPKNQELMGRGHGRNNIISKLLCLPYNYFMGSSIQKDILFPTLICMIFRNDHNYQILLKEMSGELIVEYLKNKSDSYNSISQNDFSLNNSNIDSADFYLKNKG